jgi:hypothetical protein
MSNHSLQPPSTVCEQTQEAILALLDNEFSAEQQAVLAEHLPHCPACQDYQDSMQHLTLSLRKIEEVPVPEGLELKIMNRIASQQQALTDDETPNAVELPDAPKVVATRKTLWPKMVPIAAAVLTVALSLPLIYQAINPNPGNSTGNPAMGGVHSIPANGQTTAQTQSGQHGSSFQFSPIDNNDVATTMTQAASEAIQPEHQPEQAVEQTSQPNPAGQTRTTDMLASKPDSVTVPKSANPAEVAAVLPASMSNVANTYASSEEGDIYFDPLSNVVDF